MIGTIFTLLKTGLSLWEHKEKNKYIEKALRLEKEYYEESKKPDSERDNAKLDNIEFELHLLTVSFSALTQRPTP